MILEFEDTQVMGRAFVKLTQAAPVIYIQGNWDASTNTPDITGTTTVGYAWRVSVAGNTNLNGISEWEVGDLAIYTETGFIRSKRALNLFVWGNGQGVLSDQLDLWNQLENKVVKNTAIAGATKTKITYDAKGLVTSGADATTADIADSLNKRYVSDAQLLVLGNTSGTNTGDETQSTIKTKLGVASSGVDGYLSGTDWTTFNGKQNALGFTPENVANKENTTLDTSTTKYPTNNLTKTYVDLKRQYVSVGIFGADPTFTDNGDGTATIGSFDILMKSTTDGLSPIEKYTVASSTHPFVDGTATYLYVEYNAGAPFLWVTNNYSIFDNATKIPIYKCWRVGNTIHSLSGDGAGLALSNKISNMLSATHPYSRAGESGLIISETTSPNPRTIAVTSSYVYAGTFGITVGAFNSSTNIFTRASVASSVWSYNSTALVYDNANYNPVGGITAMGVNEWSVRWFYRSIGDVNEVFWVMGTGSYNKQATAELESERTDLPVMIKQHCILIGRAVIQNGATSGSTVSAFNTTFAGASVISHNDTSNIQGGTTDQYYHLTASQNSALQDVGTLFSTLKDPTGFSDPSAVTMSYDSTTRIVTVTGTFACWYQGKIVSALTNGFTSTAHENTTGSTYWLYYNGTSLVWLKDSFPGFWELLVARVTFGASNKFCQKECHGMNMPKDVHAELHNVIGTYKYSGGTIGGVTLNSTTAANRRPSVSETVVQDEDLPVTLPLLASGGNYTRLYLTGAGATATYNVSTEIIPLSTANPYYNQNNAGTWQQTLVPANAYTCVWLMATQMTADSGSQVYRYLWIQGQSQGTLANQQALSPANLTLGTIATDLSEYVFIAKFIVRYTASDWIISQVDLLTGNKYNQTASTGGALTSVTTTANLTGIGTVASPLDTVQNIQTTSSPTFAGMALGSGSLTLTGSIGATGSRVTKVWATDLQTTNAPIVDSLTASTILGTGTSKEIVSLSTATYPSLTELSYVKGATSSLQTQLTAKPNKNYIMNPSCNISQRGDGPWNNPNNNFMIVDGWRYMKSLTGTAPVAISYLRSTLTAGLIYNTSRAITRQIYLGPMTLNANDYEYFQRKIEQGCRMLCGASKTVTLSFWAWADSNAPKIGIALVQEYGTGGSASEIINGTTITLSTTPTRYSYTFTTNTLSGKTLSTSLDDSLTTRFYYCWGTGTHSAYVGSTGVANMPSDFINITNVKLEMGSVMTEYVPNTISEDITECLRFYEQLTFTAGMILGNGWAGTTTKAYWEFYFVKKRLVPPFIGLYSTTDGIFIRRADGTNVSSTATDAGFTNASFDSCQFTTTVASGLTAGEGIGSYVATGKSVTIEIQADF